jgi:hypothetical protein
MRNGAEVDAVEREVTTTDFRENAKFTAERGKNAKFREVQENFRKRRESVLNRQGSVRDRVGSEREPSRWAPVVGI